VPHPLPSRILARIRYQYFVVVAHVAVRLNRSFIQKFVHANLHTCIFLQTYLQAHTHLTCMHTHIRSSASGETTRQVSAVYLAARAATHLIEEGDGDSLAEQVPAKHGRRSTAREMHEGMRNVCENSNVWESKEPTANTRMCSRAESAGCCRTTFQSVVIAVGEKHWKVAQTE
jgi:hypothetical protein